MQPGIGNDIFEIYKGFKTSKAEAEQKNRLMEIGGMAGSGDYQGAASKALGYGDFQSGNALLQIASGKKKEAQLDKDKLAGALFAAKDDPAKWAQVTQYAKSNGIALDPEEEDFNTGPTLLMQHMTPEGQLRTQQADRSYALQEKNFNADEAYRAQQLALEREKLTSGNKPPSGYRVSADGQGLEPIKGGPADPNKQVPVKSLRPTTDQNNAAGFYDRMTEAEKVLGTPESVAAATDYWGKKKAELPFGAGNFMASPAYQQFDQSVRDFVNAQLRKESGAAISEGEFESARKQYFPQPGDSPEVIAQKARNRATAINAMKRTAAGALTQGGQAQPQDMGQAEPGEIPSDAIAELLADPSGAEEFDAIFGPGAAEQVLGQQ